MTGQTDVIKGEISRGNLVGIVLIDLQKVFDNVDHTVISEKLRSIGVVSTAWFDSYIYPVGKKSLKKTYAPSMRQAFLQHVILCHVL